MTRPRPAKLSLLLADVDGTLVTRDKVLTDRAARAVRALRGRGVRFAITSGRPPRGTAMLVGPLGLDLPIAGFNGGLFVAPDLSAIARAAPCRPRRRGGRPGSSKARASIFGFTPGTTG